MRKKKIYLRQNIKILKRNKNEHNLIDDSNFNFLYLDSKKIQDFKN